MKTKTLFFSLSLIVVAAIIFIACNKNSPSTTHKDDSAKNTVYSGGTPLLIANIVNGNAVPVFDKDTLANSLLTSGLFDNISAADIDYGVSGAQEAAFITIIGHKSNDAVAFQAELDIRGTEIYFTPTEEPVQTMAKHTCTGHGCSSCKFIRTGLFNLKITGCECKTGDGNCDHTVTSDNGWVFQVVSILAAILGS